MMDEATRKFILGIIEASKSLTEQVMILNKKVHTLHEKVYDLEHPKEKPWT